MPLILRATKGSPLTFGEVDGNFTFLEGRIETLENDPPEAVGISNITVSGSQFTVWLANGTFFGPFTLPVAVFRWTGEWEADVAYAANDLVTVSGSLYLVLQDHISADEFDSGALSSDDLIYHLLWAPISSTFSTVVNASQTQRQIGGSEAGSYFRGINSEGLEIILPTGSAGGMTVNMEWHFYQATSAPITFTANPGVTINPYDGYANRTGGRGRVVTVKYVATDTYDIFGGLDQEDEYES